jgi:hypothetical protein
MFRKIKKITASVKGNITNYEKLEVLYNKAVNDAKSVKMNIGQLQAEFNNQKANIKNLSEVEFQIFSQGGEDGILQYLIGKLNIQDKTFIEFGVENYTEANTRFLFLKDNWSGYVIDGSPEHINYIDHNLAATGELYLKNAFITKDNINELLRWPKFNREVGILSIDIDGNDYWVWQAIDTINPIIVVAEYNSLFGVNTFWSVPYDPSFVRNRKHSSQMYYGASLQALCFLSKQKGYSFIGCNSRGNNAFFLRNDMVGNFIEPVTPEQGYVLCKFREARDEKGWISGNDRIKVLTGMEVIDVTTNNSIKIESSLVRYI